jgi:hypothetical protein
MASVTDQTSENVVDEISSIKNEDTSHFFEYKMIGRSGNNRRINVVFIGE